MKRSRSFLAFVILNNICWVKGIQTFLEVLSPPSLVRPNGYSHQAAQFGFAKCPYSYETKACQLTATVVQVDTSLCSNNVPSSPEEEIFVLLAPRGDCSYVQQARKAQLWGASGLLLADHTCLCGDVVFCTSDNPCVTTPPIVTAEGGAADISIPTVLIQKPQADAMLLLEEEEDTMTIQLQWEAVPNPQPTANLQFWHVPGSQDLPSFLGLAMASLEEQKIQFTPKFFVLSGPEFGCDPERTPTICEDHCVNNGRYCAPPDNGVAGANRLEEAVRRMCIWEHFGGGNEEDPMGAQYWNYMLAFEDNQCSEASWGDDACSKTAMEQADVDYMKVSQCVLYSGRGDATNTYLEASLTERQGLVGLVPPALVVNSVQFQARTFSEAFAGICSSFTAESSPESCTSCVACSEQEQFDCVVNQDVCVPEEEDTPIPTMAPVVPVDPQPAEDTQDASPESEQPTVQALPPTQPPHSFPLLGNDTQPTLDPTGEDRDGELPLADPTGDKQDVDSSRDGEAGGLSDNTKVVIVVAVVGGAILVIFAFVIFLVFKLLKRIRKLEKKDKHQTPTTTSPAGSNIWELPTKIYVGKEDPFNSECDPIPSEVLEQQMATEPVPNTTNNDAAVPEEANQVQNSSPSDIPTTEPNRGVLVTEPTAILTPLEGNEAPTAPGASNATKDPLAVDLETAASRDSNGDKKPNAAKSELAAHKPRAKPRRSSKHDPTWVDIMGKAAPEAKGSRSFSYGDEAKEEIVNDEDSSVLWDVSESTSAVAAN